MTQSRPPADVVSAGVVVWRPGPEVLLVHRPRYDDWSFPKGKLDPGETAAAAAVREVVEETGVRVRLGAPLATQRYPLTSGKVKDVHYWVGRAVGDDDVSGYRPNDEIDQVTWVPLAKAPAKLTYGFDQQTLAQAAAVRARTKTLIILRHGQAEARKSWPHDDRGRPLVAAGRAQAEHLTPLLAAYGVRTVATSSSARCVQTVEPYAETAGRPLTRLDGLSEEDATTEGVAAIVAELMTKRSAVLCSHRPVLPDVLAAVGLEPVKLDLAELLVVHHRADRILAIERHLTR